MIMGWAVSLAMFFVGYNLIPNVYARNFSPNVIRKLHSSKAIVALSFDDGPNPQYTPMILDLLAEHNIRATFFVLADNALRYPDIVSRMQAEGHVIGLHSTRHRSAWLSLPWHTAADFQESLEISNRLNLNIKLFRPPWGTFNLFTLHNAKKNHLQTVLWSLSPDDWRRNSSSEAIADNVMKRVQTGDIILLHDSGGATGAPARTVQALGAIIPAIQAQGLDFVTICED